MKFKRGIKVEDMNDCVSNNIDFLEQKTHLNISCRGPGLNFSERILEGAVRNFQPSGLRAK